MTRYIRVQLPIRRKWKKSSCVLNGIPKFTKVVYQTEKSKYGSLYRGLVAYQTGKSKNDSPYRVLVRLLDGFPIRRNFQKNILYVHPAVLLRIMEFPLQYYTRPFLIHHHPTPKYRHKLARLKCSVGDISLKLEDNLALIARSSLAPEIIS